MLPARSATGPVIPTSHALDEDGAILHRQLPHSQLHLLETGHCAWEEAPEQYAAITSRWLNGAYRKA